MFKKLLSKFLADRVTKGIETSEPEEFDNIDYPDNDPELYKELKTGYSSVKANKPNDYILNMISSAFYGDDLWGDHLFDKTEHQESYRCKINHIRPALEKIRDYHRKQDEYYHENYLEPELIEFGNLMNFMAYKFEMDIDIKNEVDFIMKFRGSIANLHN